jgi:uncharacterized protein (TIGR02246 family)
MRMKQPISTISALALFIWISSPAHADEADKAIRSQLDVFEQAFNSGEGGKLAGLYTIDAVAFPPGSPRVEGREAIGAMWQGAINSGIKGLELEAVEIIPAGEKTAYEVGRVSMSTPSGPAEGKYIVVWKQDDDGQWRLHRDIWNMNSQ